MGELRADPESRPLRRDAERNRQRILAAAREVFAERGLAASLDDIAARAGVGVGTVYRRFADKDALIDALFEQEVADVGAVLDAALAIADGWEALVFALTRLAEHQAHDRGFKEALWSHGHDRLRIARAAIMPRVTELIAHAQRQGALRTDIELADIQLLALMITAVADLTRDAAPEQWRRTLQIVLDGLISTRPEPTPLPGRAIGIDDLQSAVERHGLP